MNAAGTQPQASNGVPAPPMGVEGPEQESKGEYEPGEVWSPSQAAVFTTCSLKWFYRFVLNLPDEQNARRAVGKALHAAVRENFLAKLETKQDLSLTGALAIYKDAWLEEEKVTVFQKDEDRAELRAMGAKLLQKYLETTAPLIDPAAVELKVEGMIGGVLVRGYVDLLDVHGKIIDLKSAAKSPSKGKIRPDYRFQVSSYVQITPGASGEAELHTAVKLARDVKIVQQHLTITEADQRSVEVMYPLLQEAAKSGYAVPNRQSFLCSKRYCPFTRRCVEEYGGVVDGENNQ